MFPKPSTLWWDIWPKKWRKKIDSIIRRKCHRSHKLHKIVENTWLLSIINCWIPVTNVCNERFRQRWEKLQICYFHTSYLDRFTQLHHKPETQCVLFNALGLWPRAETQFHFAEHHRFWTSVTCKFCHSEKLIFQMLLASQMMFRGGGSEIETDKLTTSWLCKAGSCTDPCFLWARSLGFAPLDCWPRSLLRKWSRRSWSFSCWIFLWLILR